MKVLSREFRRLFIETLENAYAAGKLSFFGDLEPLRDPQAFAQFLAPVKTSAWVVYAKPPFGGPSHVIEYLGRYVHRVAISNRRLLHMENGQVSFLWKDYRDRQQPQKVMTVAAEEFIRRFLEHSLPDGFQRIRYYGFLANCHRARQLELCRQLLATFCSSLLPSLQACREWLPALLRNGLGQCPRCAIGRMIRILWLAPVRVDSS